jgi:hypothetical protein
MQKTVINFNRLLQSRYNMINLHMWEPILEGYLMEIDVKCPFFEVNL